MSQSSSSQGSSDLDTGVSPKKKSRLAWSYWNKETKADGKLLISELKSGEKWMDKLIFRVSLKTQMKQTKKGQVFNFNLLDDTDEISAVVFGDHAQTFYDILQLDHIYSIEDFSIQNSHPKFTGLNKQIEISVHKDTKIMASEESIREIPFDFTPINMVEECEVGSKIDVLAILVQNWGIDTPKGKVKRDISITDATKSGILATLWSEEASSFDPALYACLAIKRCTINEYDGVRSLNCGFGALVWADPKHPGKQELLAWFDSNK